MMYLKERGWRFDLITSSFGGNFATLHEDGQLRKYEIRNERTRVKSQLFLTKARLVVLAFDLRAQLYKEQRSVPIHEFVSSEFQVNELCEARLQSFLDFSATLDIWEWKEAAIFVSQKSRSLFESEYLGIKETLEAMENGN